MEEKVNRERRPGRASPKNSSQMAIQENMRVIPQALYKNDTTKPFDHPKPQTFQSYL
jgi:hypothetical protein